MEQNRPEEKTIIEEALSRGQEISFPVGEAPAKIELSLGGDGYPVYDGFVIDPDCVRPDEQVVIGRNHNR